MDSEKVNTDNKENSVGERDTHPELNDVSESIAADQQVDATGEEKDLAQKLEEANSLANQHWDNLLRTQAEIENMRKRSARDLEQARMYAIEKFVVEVLAIKDSLELGLTETKQGLEKIKEGTELTLKLMNQIFERFEIEEVSPKGDNFDPEKHQAMLTQPNDQFPAGTVLEVLQKGYLLNGRLIRPALVNVAGENAEQPKNTK